MPVGYTTNFSGQFDLDKPLLLKHFNKLRELAEKDHRGTDVPGFYCQWTPTEDGTAIVWDGNEKFYNYEEWLRYIIKNFLKPWGYVLNGDVRWNGESSDDLGVLRVKDNEVRACAGNVSYPD